MTTNFSIKTQAAAYSEGTKDSYMMLITMLEEGGIDHLLEGIEWNARPADVDRLNAYYAAKNESRLAQ